MGTHFQTIIEFLVILFALIFSEDKLTWIKGVDKFLLGKVNGALKTFDIEVIVHNGHKYLNMSTIW